MYANKLSQIILAVSVIMGVLSSWLGQGIYATQSNPPKERTWLPTIERSTPVPPTTKPIKKDPVSCDSKCKIDQLITLGIRKEIASSLVINCKALADDPVHCIKFWASLVKNESWGGYKCRSRNQYNCSGMDVSAQYKSYNDGILHWIGKYNKYWYKAKDMSHFYSVAWQLPPTRYCTSEDSSRSKVGCPYGLRNSTSFFNKITF